MINASPEQLRRAADLAEQIQSLQTELNQILAGLADSSPSATGMPKKRKKMSAAGRAAISAAAKARWRKARAKKGAAKSTKRRRMSAATKAKVSAVAKARWAKAKRAGKRQL